MNRNELKTKLTFYFDKKISIHIDTSEGKYYNGLILEINNEFIVLFDRVVGEIPITISEIVNLEKYKGDLENA